MIVEAGLILLNILCYGDIRWLLLEQILLFPCFNVLKRKKREKEKHLYEKGFQNLLQSMMTSLQAGYSLNNSCRIALKELEEEQKQKDEKRENLRKNKERFTKELEEKQAELDKITEKLSKEALEIEKHKKQVEENTDKKYEKQANIKEQEINFENDEKRQKQLKNPLPALSCSAAIL